MSIWLWSTTATSNATADPAINWSEGQAANTVNNSSRAMMQRMAELLDDLGGTVTVSGTNTLTCTTVTGFSALANGLVFAFRGANANTAAVTLAPNSLTAKKLRKFTGSGEGDLVAGDIQAGGIYLTAYSTAADGGAGAWILINLTPPSISSYAATFLDDTSEAAFKATVNLETGVDVQAHRAELTKVNLSATNIASASSIDIGAATGDFVGITGTTTISALGTADAGVERTLVFSGALILTHNGTSLILPGSANITTAAGDVAIMRSLGSGNWRCVAFTRASGVAGTATIPISQGGTGQTTAVAGHDALTTKGTDIASSATTNLASATGIFVDVTGTTTITALGTAASGVVRIVRFNGALTLTHNGSSLILPAGGSNITTAANDMATFVSLGSGNWICVAYSKASGASTGALGSMADQNANAVNISGGTITGITDLAIADGGTGASDAATARTNLGLGSMATQAAGGVAITGGTIAGITDLAIADGGTGASNATDARTNLGLVIGTNVQAFDAELAAIAGLTSAADRVPYFTGSGTAALATYTATARAMDAVNIAVDQIIYGTGTGTVTTTALSSFGRTLIDDADAATARSTLGLVIGTNVQAQDAELAAIAGLTSAADRVPYFTGSGTAALGTYTATGRALTAATIANDQLLYGNGAATVTTTPFTGFARTLVDDADAATARTTLGLTTIATQTYAEGTFTPSLVGTGTAGTTTYAANGQVGTYTRIGNRVFINVYLEWTNQTGTTALRIDGLPFTSNSTTNNISVLASASSSVTLTAAHVFVAYVLENSTSITLGSYASGGGAITAVGIDTAGFIRISGSYQI
jgi:hypothetical protein